MRAVRSDERWRGLVKKKGEFVRTAKRRRLDRRPSAFASVREELFMVIGLAMAITGMVLLFGGRYEEGKMWIAILVAQSIPYLAALIGAWLAHREGERVG